MQILSYNLFHDLLEPYPRIYIDKRTKNNFKKDHTICINIYILKDLDNLTYH